MRLIRLNCHNCNARLSVDLDNLKPYCPYCGQKLLIDMEHVEKVLAEKERANRAQEQIVQEQELTRRKQLEYEYKEKEEKRKNKTFFTTMLMLVGFSAFLVILSLILEKSAEREHLSRHEIKVTTSSEAFEKMEFTDAQKILERAGFTEIELIPAKDIVFGWFAEENEVKTITINGDDDFSSSDWFPQDATVKITYHSKKQ